MFNRVVLVGRIALDPELKYTPSGVAVANLRLAVDRPFTSSQGQRETDFIDVVAWRQSAEFAANYLSKGRLVLVEGRLQVRNWTTQDGQKRRTYEVVADAVRALDKPRAAEEETPASPSEPSADTAAEGSETEN